MSSYAEIIGNVLHMMVPIAMFFILLAIVTKRARVVGAWRRCSRETLTNFGLYVINYIILVPAMIVPILAIQEMLPKNANLVDLWNGIPVFALLAGSLLLLDFTAYWRHRFEHIKGIWRFHATHHADETMTWFSMSRMHPVSRFISLLVDNLPLMALGVPIWAIASVNLARMWWGHFIHADLRWTLGPLGRVLISPAAHRLHHTRDPRLIGRNFGTVLAIWDQVFATWADPKRYLRCQTGIAEGTRGLVGELFRPWELTYRRGRSLRGKRIAA